MLDLTKGKSLAEDLGKSIAQAGGSMVWTQMPLGSVWYDNPGIADVLALSKSYSINLRIYEVKVSRSDFQRDVNMGKYLKYLEHCTQFYFAVPAGLLKKDDIPIGCGLITRSEKGWRVQKAARRNECEFPTNLFLALLMRGFQEYWRFRPSFANGADYFEYKGLVQAASRYGKQFAADLAKAQESVVKIDEIKGEVDTALGKKSRDIQDAVWSLRHEVDRLLNKYKYSEEITKLTEALKSLFDGSLYGVGRELQEVLDRLNSEER